MGSWKAGVEIVGGTREEDEGKRPGSGPRRETPNESGRGGNQMVVEVVDDVNLDVE